MDDLELVRRKKKKKAGDVEGVYSEMELDLDSDYPIHEKFVDERGLREIKRKIRKV